MEYKRQSVYEIIPVVRIRYYREAVIQIFKTSTETRIRCYIGIFSCILTDSYKMNKREYRLHVFIEYLYNNILGKLFKKYTRKLCFVLTPILSKYGRIRCKTNPYSRWFCVVSYLQLFCTFDIVFGIVYFALALLIFLYWFKLLDFRKSATMKLQNFNYKTVW